MSVRTKTSARTVRDTKPKQGTSGRDLTGQTVPLSQPNPRTSDRQTIERLKRSEQILNPLIDRALKGNEPDPHAIAWRLIPLLSSEVTDSLIYSGLFDRVRKAIHRERNSVGSNAVRSEGQPRWKMAERVCPGGTWKMLADCGAEDLLLLADEYRVRTEQMAQREAEYRSLAEALVASGCATLGEMWAAASKPEDLAA